MSDPAERLGAARAAYGRREWAQARAGYLAADGEAELSTDDLAAWGEAAWWLGEVEETLSRWTEAHRRYLAEKRQDRAALLALSVAVNHFLRGEHALGSGWMGRALRLAGELPEGPVHGYILYISQVEAALGGEDAQAVLAAARRVRELGRRFTDPNLVALGLVGEGRTHVKEGGAEQGMALLDEAMVSVMAGELDPDWAGNTYCHMIAACHELGDWRRMKTWTEATERWLATLPSAVLFSGICRVHRTQLLGATGHWEQAEREAKVLCKELEGISAANTAEAHYQLGELRRLRGDHRGAGEAYRRAHECGRDPQPGLARLHLARNRLADAVSSIRAALLAVGNDRLARVRLCFAQAEIALAAGDPTLARVACEELAQTAHTYAGAELMAMAASASGGLALAEGRLHDALPELREACRRWRALEAPYEAARACVPLARAYRALGDADAAGRELAAAAAEFERLGAAPDVAQVAELRKHAALPAGLTDREREVLRLVAEGKSNAHIAADLFISTKTVARHLSNIFAKTGAASRTEAARYAFDHGLD